MFLELGNIKDIIWKNKPERMAKKELKTKKNEKYSRDLNIL